MRTPTPIALLLALAAAGCSAVVDPQENEPLSTAEGFCNSIQDVANRLTCGVLSVGPAMTIQVQAQAASDQLFEAYRGRCDALQAEVDGGRYRYDPGAAPGCIAALQARGCRGMDGAYFAWPAECARVLEGNVPAGGGCLHDTMGYATVQGGTAFRLNECAGGASCVGSGAPPVCGSATCRPPAVAGGACLTANNPENCAEGLYCDSFNLCQFQRTDPVACASAPMICDPRSAACNFTSGSCEPLPAEGEPCSGSVSPPCRPGLVCDVSTNSCVSKPAAPIGEGVRCLSTSYCADGLYCDTANTHLCVRQRTSGTCMYGDECAPGYGCVYGGTSNTCMPLSDLGGPCTTDTVGSRCKPGLYCDAVYPVVSGSCALAPGVGEPCLGAGAATGVCAPGLRPVTPPPPDYTCRCQPFLGEGELCSMSDECGYYAGTGRECVDDGTNTRCRTNVCLVPAGWFAKGSMY